MQRLKTILTTAAVLAAFPLSALAQDRAFELPEQCIASTGMGGMDHMSMNHDGMDAAGMAEMHGIDLEAMPDHVQENMRRMMITMPAMELGVMNEDADVAFACAMIAHHQGAIDMAQVLLDHGDDPEMIRLAGEIIAAQAGEIELMTGWLAEQAN